MTINLPKAARRRCRQLVAQSGDYQQGTMGGEACDDGRG